MVKNHATENKMYKRRKEEEHDGLLLNIPQRFEWGCLSKKKYSGDKIKLIS